MSLNEIAGPAAEFATGLAVGTATNVASTYINSKVGDNLAIKIAVAGGLAGTAMYLTTRYVTPRLPNTSSGLLFFAMAFVVSQPELLDDLRSGSQWVSKMLMRQ